MSGGGACVDCGYTDCTCFNPQLPKPQGQKFDTNKQQWYRLPLVVLHPLADAYCIGGVKYPAFNCLQPFNEGDSRLWDATLRHLEQCQIDPLAIDPEDGCYHAAKASFSILTRLYNARLQRGDFNALKD